MAAGKLFVADTNNHLIRTIDLKTLQVSTLAIAGLKPPEPPAAAAKRPAGSIEKLPPAVVRAEHGELRLRVELEFPEGYKINALAPLEYRVERCGAGSRKRAGVDSPRRVSASPSASRSRQPSSKSACRSAARRGGTSVQVAVDYYYCREGSEGLCKIGSAAWIVPVELSATAETVGRPPAASGEVTIRPPLSVIDLVG